MSRGAGKLRRLGVGVGLAVVATAAALGGAEVAVRELDLLGVSYFRDTLRYRNEAIELPPEAARPDGRIFQNRAGVDLELETFRYATGPLGLRAPAPDAPPSPPGAHRVLFLGDSVTLAWGVDDEESWVRLVERSARGPEGEPLACLNAGHLHYDTVQEHDWLLAFGPALEPDAVVVTFVVNDLDATWEQYAAVLAGEVEPPSALEAWVSRRLPGLHGVWSLLRSRRELRARAEAAGDGPEHAAGYAAAWARTERALDGILAFCEARGAPLVVLDHANPPVPDLRAWCEANGVPWFDFWFTEEEWARDVRNSVADEHANELGNRLLAAKALAALAEAGVVEPVGDPRR